VRQELAKVVLEGMQQDALFEFQRRQTKSPVDSVSQRGFGALRSDFPSSSLTAVIFPHLRRRDHPLTGAASARGLTDVSAIGSTVVVADNSIGSRVSHSASHLGANAGDELQWNMQDRQKDAAKHKMTAFLLGAGLLGVTNAGCRQDRNSKSCGGNLRGDGFFHGLGSFRWVSSFSEAIVLGFDSAVKSNRFLWLN